MKSQLDNVKINTELIREKWVVTFTIGIQKFTLYPCESSTEAQFMENMLRNAFKNLLICPENLDEDRKFIDNATKYDYYLFESVKCK